MFRRPTRDRPHRFFIRWVPKPKQMKKIGELHVRLYQATGGKVGGFLDGLDMLLLTTLGRKSGLLRTVAIPYFEVDGKLVIIASYGGNPKNPAWYLNLRDTADVQVQIGGEARPKRARTATGEERARLWRAVADVHPRFDRYLEWCKDREIPVVVLDPA